LIPDKQERIISVHFAEKSIDMLLHPGLEIRDKGKSEMATIQINLVFAESLSLNLHSSPRAERTNQNI
jgi:hypothetical protein